MSSSKTSISPSQHDSTEKILATAGSPARTSDPQQQVAAEYLSRLLNRNLHIYTDDGRMFAGVFKCTDSERNIVLASTFEYRLDKTRGTSQPHVDGEGQDTPALTADVIPRFMGLVVVPGQHIIKIEVEEGRGYGAF